MVVAALAILLGLLPVAHAIGPLPSCADDVSVPAFVDVLTPPSSPFLAAYRANGPPDGIVILIPADTAVEDRSGSPQQCFVVLVCKTRQSAGCEEDAYGKRTVLAPDGVSKYATSKFGNQWGFTGRYHDDETGLQFFRARYYSAELGRFVNRDPAGYVNGFGLYGAYYVPNGVDPNGPRISATTVHKALCFHVHAIVPVCVF
jgi:RHS repeat-associated protein